MHAQACFESLAVCAALLAVYLVLVGLACTNLVRGFSQARHDAAAVAPRSSGSSDSLTTKLAPLHEEPVEVPLTPRNGYRVDIAAQLYVLAAALTALACITIVVVTSFTSRGAEYHSPKRSRSVTSFMAVSGITSIIEALVLQNAVISPVLEGYVALSRGSLESVGRTRLIMYCTLGTLELFSVISRMAADSPYYGFAFQLHGLVLLVRLMCVLRPGRASLKLAKILYVQLESLQKEQPSSSEQAYVLALIGNVMRWTRLMLWLMSMASGAAIAAIVAYVSRPETVPMLVPLVGIAIAHMTVLVVVMLLPGVPVKPPPTKNRHSFRARGSKKQMMVVVTERLSTIREASHESPSGSSQRTSGDKSEGLYQVSPTSRDDLTDQLTEDAPRGSYGATSQDGLELPDRAPIVASFFTRSGRRVSTGAIIAAVVAPLDASEV